MKALKTICNYSGLFIGNIPDIKTYEELKNGQIDWKPYIKPKLEAVTIPYELFERLMKLDKERENNNVELECMHFKDISKLIKSPFSIGEKVYGFTFLSRDIIVVAEETVKAIKYGDFGNGEIGFIAVETDEAEYDWRIKEQRNMLFKTKEEAEKALKEREQE